MFVIRVWEPFKDSLFVWSKAFEFGQYTVRSRRMGPNNSASEYQLSEMILLKPNCCRPAFLAQWESLVEPKLLRHHENPKISLWCTARATNDLIWTTHRYIICGVCLTVWRNRYRETGCTAIAPIETGNQLTVASFYVAKKDLSENDRIVWDRSNAEKTGRHHFVDRTIRTAELANRLFGFGYYFPAQLHAPPCKKLRHLRGNQIFLMAVMVFSS